MAILISAYKTSDGEIFEELYKAKEHEFKLQLTDFIRPLTCNNPEDFIRICTTYRNKLHTLLNFETESE